MEAEVKKRSLVLYGILPEISGMRRNSYLPEAKARLEQIE